MDEATGLLYVGNGQYYDPATGRFLNRNARPEQTNPYVPWSTDPTGALFSPLLLLAMVFSNKKKCGKHDQLMIILVIGVLLFMSLSCAIVDIISQGVQGIIDAVTGLIRPPGSLNYPGGGTELGITPGPTDPPVIEPETPCPGDPPGPDDPIVPDDPIIPDGGGDGIGDGGGDGGIEDILTSIPENLTELPSDVPQDLSLLRYNKAVDFYQYLLETPGWWHSYQGHEFNMQTYIAIVYNYEAALYIDDEDEPISTYMTEAFSRRFWDAINLYGQFGLYWYIGSRQAVTNFIKNPAPINQKDYNIDKAYGCAGLILSTDAWKQGPERKAPWEWGNTNDYWYELKDRIPAFYNALASGKIKSFEDDYVLYRDVGPAPNYFFIVTKGQQEVLCLNRSCVTGY